MTHMNKSDRPLDARHARAWHLLPRRRTAHGRMRSINERPVNLILTADGTRKGRRANVGDAFEVMAKVTACFVKSNGESSLRKHAGRPRKRAVCVKPLRISTGG